VPVLPPDVNASELQFVVQPDGVRFGLGAIKGAGEGAILSILDSRRQAGGKIRSLFALVEHADLRLVNRKVLECLAKAGAFDSLAPGGREDYLAWRPRLVAGLDRLLDHGSRHQKDRDQGQSQLFAAGPEAELEIDDGAALPDAKPWTETEALAFEKEALGLYMSGHPLQRFAGVLKAVGGRRLADLQQSENDCAIGGVVTGVRQLKTKRGERMAVFTLEEEAAKVETVVFPEAFGKFGHAVVEDAMVLVRGRFEKDEESSRMLASEITPLDVVRDRAVREVQIRLAGRMLEKDVMRQLGGTLERHAGDRRIAVLVDVNGNNAPLHVRIAIAHRVRPSERFVKDVEAICGAGSVTLV
jgi:DNA polymerase-3 subunit alpha